MVSPVEVANSIYIDYKPSIDTATLIFLKFESFHILIVVSPRSN